jgi:histidinol-phosphatase (PHP family)
MQKQALIDYLPYLKGGSQGTNSTKSFMWSNFHTHSNYCDGKGELSEYVIQAMDLGMLGLGFSSHAPLPFQNSWCMNNDKLSKYYASLGELKTRHPELSIYTGLEIDFIPGVISPREFEPNLDYSIGSIHFVDRFDDGRHWEIDGTHLLFLEGLDKIFTNNIRAAVVRYFELTRQMLLEAAPTIVGHLDKIKIQNPDNKFFQESDEWYQTEIKKTLALIKESGAIVEVNTRGLYQKKSLTTYPSPWVLEEIHRLSIPITLSSDAHHPKDIINCFEDTARLLLGIGFRKLSVLRHRQWEQLNFDENGIKHGH